MLYICPIIHEKSETMTAKEFAKQWTEGNIVGCKESTKVARRHLKTDLDIETYNQIVGMIEWVNFYDRAKCSVKNWRLK